MMKEEYSNGSVVAKHCNDHQYECPICCEWYDNKHDKDICAKHCSLAIEAYMRDRHINRDQAIKQYRLEGL